MDLPEQRVAAVPQVAAAGVVPVAAVESELDAVESELDAVEQQRE